MRTLRRNCFIGFSWLALFATSGCGGSSDAAGAAAAVSIAVAESAVNRAVTKDCWARCSTGWICNQESGLCEKGECTPSCAPGYACTRSRGGNTCAAEGAPLFDPVGDPALSDRLGPRGVPGDPLAPETAAERNAKNPEKNEGGQVTLARGTQGPVGSSPEKELDDPRKVSAQEMTQRGAQIFRELESLVAVWGPRIEAENGGFPQVVKSPQTGGKPQAGDLADYAETLHRSSVHDVYSRGWLASLESLSQTHALSSRGLRVTLGLEIAKDTGALTRLVVLESSGSELFDVGTLEAITRSAPFPPPPEALVDGGAALYLKWRLFRHIDYACSTSFVEQLVP
jgi:hypothetical protein